MDPTAEHASESSQAKFRQNFICQKYIMHFRSHGWVPGCEACTLIIQIDQLCAVWLAALQLHACADALAVAFYHAPLQARRSMKKGLVAVLIHTQSKGTVLSKALPYTLKMHTELMLSEGLITLHGVVDMPKTWAL